MTRNRLRALHYDNVLVRRGEGLDGWPEEALFDAIVVFATAGQVGPSLLSQLAIGASLILPERPFRPEQHLVRFQRTAEDVYERSDLGLVRLVPRLGDLLVDAGLLERDIVEIAAHAATAAELMLGEQLIRDGDLEESDLYRVLALQGGRRFASIETLVRCADAELARSVSRVFAERHQVIPLLWSKGRPVVATCTPGSGLAELAQVFGASETETILVTPTDFRRFWSHLDLGHDQEDERSEFPPADVGDLLTATAGVDAHAVALLDALLLDAIAERAGDIHLETYEGRSACASASTANSTTARASSWTVRTCWPS
jgi:type IV pilus assembly protein PilB